MIFFFLVSGWAGAAAGGRPRCASAMELEDLYRRYCVRLKHALFHSCLAVATVASGLGLICVFLHPQVSHKHETQSYYSPFPDNP